MKPGAIDALCDRWAKSAAASAQSVHTANVERAPASPSESASTAPPAPAPAPAPRVASSSGSGGQSAQLASTTSQASASDLLTRLKARHPQSFEGLQTRIEPADVGGTVHYRLIVSGFTTSASVKSFCTQVQPTGGCLIRSTD